MVVGILLVEETLIANTVILYLLVEITYVLNFYHSIVSSSLTELLPNFL